MNSHRPSEEELFEAALQFTDPAERAAYLQHVCGDDLQLRQQVESLLAAHAEVGTFIDKPAVDQGTVPLNTGEILPRSEQSGDRIGRFKLLEKIGEGGFGDVWMAEQEEPVRRRVALKIIKLGMDTREVIARFEAERQALALMEHPSISRVFDGGSTETGRPYFVMELVRGVPITTYCDAHRLSVDERLELFMQVCQAVQHAHQKGVIHRDLKSSNVLVSVQDNRPVPKVIDFGIAKATAQRLTERTIFTRFHQFVGTPAYMSPEQTGANREDIDTRSDIYSLGVLLYELLTGKTPFDTQKLLEAGYEAILKTIREQEPPNPSTRLTTLTKQELGLVAAERRTAPDKLGKTVRGELDWIVMMCLEKDRTRRYGTADALATDINRHLKNEPVFARAPSQAYLLGKFLKRRSREVVLGVVSLLTVASLALLAHQVRHAQKLRAEKILAQVRQEELEVVNRILAGLPLSRLATEQIQMRLSRLANRVSQGMGNEIDHETIARLLCRGVVLQGDFFQEIDRPFIRLNAVSPGDGYDIRGVGVVLTPEVTLNGRLVEFEGWPCYLSGRSSNSSSLYGGKLKLDGIVTSSGMHEISCALEAQLVRTSRNARFGGGEPPADGVPIGKPVHIPLQPARRFFVWNLPEAYPVEIIDPRASQAVMDGLHASNVIVSLTPDRDLVGKFILVCSLPNPIMPVALQIGVAAEGEDSFQTNLGRLIVTDRGEVGFGGASDFSMNRIAGGGWSVTMRTPIALPSKLSNKILEHAAGFRAVVTFRSSKEIARSLGFEHFLAVPEVKREVTVQVERAPP